jgi:uncharacterized RDD family membrane protein YckC
MIDDSFGLRTPEQIELSYDLAGLGSRFLAALLDGLLQGVLIVALIFGLGMGSALLSAALERRLSVDPTILVVTAISLALLAIFLVIWGYFIFFELVWNGQTPGKRAVGIRVLTVRGEPVTFVHVLVRNLLRVVDFLPSSYIVGAVSILVTRRSQRLGDLAAGTIVVHERSEAIPRTLPTLDPSAALPPQLAAIFTREDVALARDFILRAGSMSPRQRQELGARIAEALRHRLAASGQPVPADLTDDHLLAGVAALRK